MEVIVNVNINGDDEEPKVEIKRPLKKKNNIAGGVLQFPEEDEVQNNNSILDMLGIGRT